MDPTFSHSPQSLARRGVLPAPHLPAKEREYNSYVLHILLLPAPNTERIFSVLHHTHHHHAWTSPRLEYSRSSASDSHLTLKLRCYWRTRTFPFPLCAHSDQGLSSSCVRCVASIYCSRNSAGPPFWGYLVRQAGLEVETRGFLPLEWPLCQVHGLARGRHLSNVYQKRDPAWGQPSHMSAKLLGVGVICYLVHRYTGDSVQFST